MSNWYASTNSALGKLKLIVITGYVQSLKAKAVLRHQRRGQTHRL